MRRALIILFVFATGLGWAQDFTEDSLVAALEKVNNPQEADIFARNNAGRMYLSSIVFDTYTDSSELAQTLAQLDTGSVLKLTDSTGHSVFYKIIKHEGIIAIHAHYIFFSGADLSLINLNKKRSEALKKIQSGKLSFCKAAEKYGMDHTGKYCGEMGWRDTRELQKDFYTEVINHNVSDIFTVDIPDKNWFYIVQKESSERKGKKLVVLVASVLK